MNSFANFLGKPNGKEMVSTILSEGVSKEQARAAIVTYLLLFGIQEGSNEFHDFIHEMFNYYNSWFSNKTDFERYIREIL